MILFLHFLLLLLLNSVDPSLSRMPVSNDHYWVLERKQADYQLSESWSQRKRHLFSVNQGPVPGQWQIKTVELNVNDVSSQF